MNLYDKNHRKNLYKLLFDFLIDSGNAYDGEESKGDEIILEYFYDEDNSKRGGKFKRIIKS